MNAQLYRQREATINGRHIAFYHLTTEIGYTFNIVEWQDMAKGIQHKSFDGVDYDKVEAYYERICKKILSGKI